MLDQLEYANRSARPIRATRDNLGTSKFLEEIQRSELDPEMRQCLQALLKAPLFNDLTKEGILWLTNKGQIICISTEELIVHKGDTIDHMLVIVMGTVEVINDLGGKTASELWGNNWRT